ncbi:hypothetical protein V9L05_01620 [Bernardetia sp. Wsw4-3y2]|uniref:hypothetical protein n=1 Tax=unclassified Bernardetia TaxID=2647129 RepID=UPI0030D2263C
MSIIVISTFSSKCVKAQDEISDPITALMEIGSKIQRFNNDSEVHDIIKNISKVVSDTAILNPIRRGDEIILLEIELFSYSDSLKHIIEVKNTNKYVFTHYDEVSEEKHLQMNIDKITSVWNRSGSLKINDVFYSVVQMNTQIYHLENGYIIINTAFKLE